MTGTLLGRSVTRSKSHPPFPSRVVGVMEWLAAKPLLSGRQLVVACSYAGIWYPLEAMASLERQGLVSHVVAPGGIDTKLSCYYQLTHRGIIALARHQKASATDVAKKYWLSAGRMSTLVRALGHTDACYQFFVDMIARSGGTSERAARVGLIIWHGEAEAYRRYHLDGRDRYLRPDGYGRYRSSDQEVLFFLEWDSGNMADARHRRKFHAYQCYQSWWEEHKQGTLLPAILMVVPTQSQAVTMNHLVIELASAAHAPPLPVFLTTHEALKQSGPLKARWWDVARQELANPFNSIQKP